MVRNTKRWWIVYLIREMALKGMAIHVPSARFSHVANGFRRLTDGADPDIFFLMNADVQLDPVVRLTESAARQVQAMLVDKPEDQGKTLRIYIEDGGCSGMQYGMVFDEPRENDRVSQLNGVSVLIDPISAQYLQGAVVDFNDGLDSHGFKITNPNARQTCGCGKSFDA